MVPALATKPTVGARGPKALGLACRKEHCAETEHERLFQEVPNVVICQVHKVVFMSEMQVGDKLQ